MITNDKIKAAKTLKDWKALKDMGARDCKRSIVKFLITWGAANGIKKYKDNGKDNKLYLYVDRRTKRVVYVGQTYREFNHRHGQHMRDKKHFSKAIREHGADNFLAVPVFTNLTRTQANTLERYYIEYFDTCFGEHGFNENTGGGAGHVVSAKTIAKMSLAQKGKNVTTETKAKMSLAKKGKKHTAEHRANNSLAKKGKKHTTEHKANLSLAATGRKHSPETIAKREATKRANRAAKLNAAKKAA